MALDARFVVGAGSGALWMALGVFVLLVARSWKGRAYGALAFAFGGQFVTANLAFATEGADVPFVAATFVMYALGAVAAGALVWASPRGRGLVALGVLVAAVSVVADAAVVREALMDLGMSPAAADLFVRVVWPVSSLELAFLGMLLIGLALGARADPSDRAGPFVAASFGVYLAYNSTSNAAGLSWARYGPFVAVLTAAAIVWLAATPRVGRPARGVALALLAAAVAGAATGTWAGQAVLGIGVTRTLGAALFAFAIFRHDLLGVPLPRLAANRGTLAAGSLAVLFVVAQVAQEFLSASYGLLTGGIVAGAFLFAAQPVQRAMERMSARGPEPGAAPDTDAAARRERLYRNALGVALKDRVLTRDEEVHLHRLAEELGIGAGRAHELLVEAEREARGP